MKDKIKIAGAGLSGLTSAINLKKAGYSVEVYETNAEVGAAKNGDWQGLENWTENTDVIERIKSSGLDINFDYHPFREFTFYSHDLDRFKFKCQKPIFYLVKRGDKKGNLDYSLKDQAESSGVKIHLKSSLKAGEADIVASGGKEPYAMGIGINFETDLKNEGIGILDDDLAPKGYSYFLTVDGRATLVSAFFSGYGKKPEEYFEKTLATFKKLRKFRIKNEKKFAGIITKGLSFKSDNIYIGEAGGFMDYFLGFGMYHAIRSGYLAARAVASKENFADLRKKELDRLIKCSKINRFVFKKIGNNGYKILLKKLLSKTDFRRILRRGYTHDITNIEALKIFKKYV